MNIEKGDHGIDVEFDDKKIHYDKREWTDEENYLSDGGVIKLEEWKIDLINNYGVELDELRS